MCPKQLKTIRDQFIFTRNRINVSKQYEKSTKLQGNRCTFIIRISYKYCMILTKYVYMYVFYKPTMTKSCQRLGFAQLPFINIFVFVCRRIRGDTTTSPQFAVHYAIRRDIYKYICMYEHRQFFFGSSFSFL